MRTTITLEAAAAALVKKAMAERKATFKDIVNEAIVRGLTNERSGYEFRTKTHSMGRPLLDLDKASQVAAELDNEEFLRTMAAGQ